VQENEKMQRQGRCIRKRRKTEEGTTRAKGAERGN
jgi:hypothetical protein